MHIYVTSRGPILSRVALRMRLNFFPCISLKVSSHNGLKSSPKKYTAIPYRASKGPEQGFPCVLFPVRKSTQGKPCFHCRDPVFITGNHVFITGNAL